jgi:hypothetical protein
MADPNSVVIPKPQRLSVSETEYGLVQVTIQLRKRVITVTESNYFSSFRQGNLFTVLDKEFNDNDGEDSSKTTEQIVQENLLFNVWVPLVSCSAGDVPTKDEFLWMSEIDIQFWVETARELGIKFPWLDALEQAVTEAGKEAQKKVGKRTRSK